VGFFFTKEPRIINSRVFRNKGLKETKLPRRVMMRKGVKMSNNMGFLPIILVG